MFAANDSSASSGLRRALAGLQAGVFGALAMLACLGVGSLWDRRSIWLVPNLLATTFFGSDAYRNQLMHTSWSGVALIVAFYGFLGLVWGCIWGEARTQWLGFYGAITGLSVYFLVFRVLLRHANPRVALYAPDTQLEIGHLFWGLFLARSPKYARRIAERSAEAAVQDKVHEVSSGEVIR
jgi:hypothetical protein